MSHDSLRRGLAELIGSFALTFVGAGAILNGANDLFAIAAAHALTLAIFVSALGHISGGHFNPAVTLGFLVTKRITKDLAFVYWAFQFAGGVLAATMLRVVYDDRIADGGDLGIPRLGEGVAGWEGLILEIVMTFFLVFVVFATAVDPRGAFKYVAGFAIGLTIGVDILIGGPLTGAAMNPQRAFGPELMSWTWSDAWVYYLGPAIGGVLAALAYDRLYLRPMEVETAGGEGSGIDEAAVKRAADS